MKQQAFAAVPGSRGGFGLDSGGTALSSNPLWQPDGIFAASGSGYNVSLTLAIY